MSKNSILVQNIDSRVPNEYLRRSMEQQVTKLIRKNTVYIGIIVLSVFSVVILFFLFLGTDSASNLFFIVLIPILTVIVNLSLPLKDVIYRRQLKKLGQSVSYFEANKPLVVRTVDGRGFVDVRDGVLRLFHTKGSRKTINLSKVSSVEVIHLKDNPYIFAIFSDSEAVCFFLVDDLSEATQRQVTTNIDAAAAVDSRRTNNSLKEDFLSRFNQYENIKIFTNEINKSRTEIPATKATVIIIASVLIAIFVATAVYFMHQNTMN